MGTTALAHPNIALIKYWGKQPGPGNRPATPSLSITLDDLTTHTTVTDAPQDRVVLNGRETADAKILDCLAQMRADFDFGRVEIDSTNNFPTAAGLASSASGFAALITALNAHFGLGLTDERRSEYARRASGSAARSIFGGFVGLAGPDWIAEPLLHRREWPLRVVIAIADAERKNTSSTEGMKRSEQTSPFYPSWVSSTATDYQQALTSLNDRNFQVLAELAEHSCLKMHGVMHSSRPPMLYWRPATLGCIQAVRELRADGVPVFFTIDAGPQLKAVCLPEAEDPVRARLGEIPGVLDVRCTGLGDGARVEPG